MPREAEAAAVPVGTQHSHPSPITEEPGPPPAPTTAPAKPAAEKQPAAPKETGTMPLSDDEAGDESKEEKETKAQLNAREQKQAAEADNGKATSKKMKAVTSKGAKPFSKAETAEGQPTVAASTEPAQLAHNTASTKPAASEEPTTLAVSTNDLPPAAAMEGRKHIVLSLIRHGESESQRSFLHVDPPLTKLGERQVLCLGKEWEDVKIDHLYSSTMERAYQTALALAEANSGKPKVIPNSTLVERKNGEELISLFRSGGNTTYAMYGTFVAPRKTEDIDRDWAPPRGGESLNDVSRRAERFVREVVLRHGKELEASLESLKDGLGPVIAKSLPNGIPHVVIVAHNIFLVELFESLLSQGSVDHVTTDCHYENISWSRHIVSFVEGGKLEHANLKSRASGC